MAVSSILSPERSKMTSPKARPNTAGDAYWNPPNDQIISRTNTRRGRFDNAATELWFHDVVAGRGPC
jgi:hypothetical protein